MLQCVVGCCRVLALLVRLKGTFAVAVCCRVLQGVAGCCRMLQCVVGYWRSWSNSKVRWLVHCVAGCCRVLQGVAGCCSGLALLVREVYPVGSIL